MIASYRNQLLHYLIRPAILAYILNKHSNGEEKVTFTRDSCAEDFSFLSKLLCKDFIFVPGKTDRDLDEAIQFYTAIGVLSKDNSKYTVESHANRVLVFMRTVFSSFVVGYWLTSQFLISSETSLVIPNCYTQIQQWIAAHLDTPGVEHEMLSLNLISHAVHGLEGLGGVIINKNQTPKMLDIVPSRLVQLAFYISQFTEVPKINGNSPLVAFNPLAHKL
uniref:GPAT/DHAPAT C-terminal domain-containing protein n=1 Tax=Ciona savignyi TaxID=51511 RepID=H2YD90_CIOSA